MSSTNHLTVLQTIILLISPLNQRLVQASELVNSSELTGKSPNNGTDQLFSEIVATNIDSGEVSSQENFNSNGEKWASAEFLPLSSEDFPVAAYSSSKSRNEAQSQESSSTTAPSTPSESSFTPLIASAASSAEAEDVLRRMGWTTGEESAEQGNRFSAETKPWSKALPSQSTSATASASPIANSNPGINGNGHHQDMLRAGSAPSPVVAGNEPLKENNQPSVGNQIDYNVEDLSASATSNNYDVPSSSSSSSQYTYSSSGSSGNGAGSPSRTRYGYRVNSRNREPEYSSSNNYDDFSNPEYSSATGNEAGFNEGPYEGGLTTGNDEYRGDLKQSTSPSSGSHPPSEYERDVRPTKYNSYSSRPRFRPRNQYMSASSWPEYAEFEASPADRGWLASLFGGYGKQFRPRYRGPYGLSGTESLPMSTLPLNFFEPEGFNLMRPPPMAIHPHSHPARAATSWAAFAPGFAAPRPHATNLRPAYAASYPFVFGPRSPMAAPPPGPYYAPAGQYGSASSMMPFSVRPYSFASFNGVLASPSVSYPVKIPYSPYPVFNRGPYPMMRPFMANDLVFAESLRKMNVTGNGDKMEASASQNAMSFVPPPLSGLPPNQPGHPVINRQGSEQMFNFFNPVQWTNSVTKAPEGESSTQNPQDGRAKSSNVVGRLFGRWLA